MPPDHYTPTHPRKKGRFTSDAEANVFGDNENMPDQQPPGPTPQGVPYAHVHRAPPPPPPPYSPTPHYMSAGTGAYSPKPGIVTALGVLSIVVASLTFIA